MEVGNEVKTRSGKAVVISIQNAVVELERGGYRWTLPMALFEKLENGWKIK